MYNEILSIMDHNTVMEMLKDKNGIIAKMDTEIANKNIEIANKDSEIEALKAEVARLTAQQTANSTKP